MNILWNILMNKSQYAIEYSMEYFHKGHVNKEL